MQDGAILHRYSDSGDSATFCALAEDCVARSGARGRQAILLVDYLNIRVPEQADKDRNLIQRHGIGWSSSAFPSTQPSCQPHQTLVRVWQSRTTHNRQRTTLEQPGVDSC